MIAFLTSSPVICEGKKLNPANGFLDTLRAYFPANCRGLFICSSPDKYALTDAYASDIKTLFTSEGLPFTEFRILDGRNPEQAADLVKQSDMVFLAGGHVPTQNHFFQKINLRELLRDYSGIILGTSAGSMNSADIVYAQPEEEGEAIDPAYQRFLPGLGLTKTMLLPHYQFVKDEVLDGLRVIEDITFADSMGREFIAIPDGSYLLIQNGREELRGEAYRIHDGEIVPV